MYSKYENITISENNDIKEILTHIEFIEKKTYPEYMRCYNDLSIEKLLNYVKSDSVNIIILNEDGYIIYTKDEINDWVSSGNPFDIFYIRKQMKLFYKNNFFLLNLRVKTSWPIIDRAIELGVFDFDYCNTYYWENEEMAEIKLKFN